MVPVAGRRCVRERVVRLLIAVVTTSSAGGYVTHHEAAGQEN